MPKSLDELAKEAEYVSSKIDEKIQSIKRRNKKIKVSALLTLLFLISITAAYLNAIYFPRKKVEKEIQTIIYLTNKNNIYEADKLSENLQKKLENKGLLNIFFRDLYNKIANYDNDVIDKNINLLKPAEYKTKFSKVQELVNNNKIEEAYDSFTKIYDELKNDDFNGSSNLLNQFIQYFKNHIKDDYLKLIRKKVDEETIIVKFGISEKEELDKIRHCAEMVDIIEFNKYLRSSLVDVFRGRNSPNDFKQPIYKNKELVTFINESITKLESIIADSTGDKLPQSLRTSRNPSDLFKQIYELRLNYLNSLLSIFKDLNENPNKEQYNIMDALIKEGIYELINKEEKRINELLYKRIEKQLESIVN